MQFTISQRRAPPSQRAYNRTRTWTERLGLIVTMQDELGNSVCIEAAPLPGYSPDALEDSLAWLTRHQSRSYPDPEARSLDGLLAEITPLVQSAPVSARFAMEFGFLQLAAGQQGVPLRALLSPARYTAGRPSSSAVLVDLHSPDLVDTLRHLAQAPNCVVKVKIGLSLTRELRALEQLRHHLPRARLRADANGAWSMPASQGVLEELSRFELEFIEEPFRLTETVATQAPSAFAVGLAWDESLFGLDPTAPWLQNWLGRQDCRVLVLKPMCVGGCARLREWVRAADRIGLEVVFSHLFDGSYAAHIYAELAAAWGSRKFAMGLGQQRENLPW